VKVGAAEYFQQNNNILKYQYPIFKAKKLIKNYNEAVGFALEHTQIDGKYWINLPKLGFDLHPYTAIYYPYFIYEIGTLYQEVGESQKALQAFEHLLDLWKNADEDMLLYKKTKQIVSELKAAL